MQKYLFQYPSCAIQQKEAVGTRAHVGIKSCESVIRAGKTIRQNDASIYSDVFICSNCSNSHSYVLQMQYILK